MSPEAFWIWKMTLIIICDNPPAASFLEFLPPAKSQPHPLLSTGIMTFASWYFSPLLPFNAAVLILWIFRYQKGSLIRHGHVSIQLCMTSRQFMPVTTFFSYFGEEEEMAEKSNWTAIIFVKRLIFSYKAAAGAENSLHYIQDMNKNDKITRKIVLKSQCLKIAQKVSFCHFWR